MPSAAPPNAHPDSFEVPAAAHILGIRFSALGDTLLTFPALRLLRATYPNARLTFLTDTRCAGLFDGLEVLDELLTLDRLGLKRLRPGAVGQLVNGVLRPAICRRWDIVIDFQSFTETAIISALTRAPIRVGRRYKTGARALYRPWIDAPHEQVYMTGAHIDTIVRAGLVEAPPAGERTCRSSFYRVPAAAADRWRDRRAMLQLPPADQAPSIAFFVGAAKAQKLWPAKRFAQLAGRLASELPHSFLVFAGPGEQELARQVVQEAAQIGLAERIANGGCGELATLAAAFSACSATVSNDTGPMHLSVAVGTPTLGICRSANPHFIPPPPHRHVVARREQIDAISVDQVAADALQLLAR